MSSTAHLEQQVDLGIGQAVPHPRYPLRLTHQLRKFLLVHRLCNPKKQLGIAILAVGSHALHRHNPLIQLPTLLLVQRFCRCMACCNSLKQEQDMVRKLPTYPDAHKAGGLPPRDATANKGMLSALTVADAQRGQDVVQVAQMMHQKFACCPQIPHLCSIFGTLAVWGMEVKGRDKPCSTPNALASQFTTNLLPLVVVGPVALARNDAKEQRARQRQAAARHVEQQVRVVLQDAGSMLQSQ